MKLTGRALALAVLMSGLAGCSDSPTSPSAPAIVTFRVVNETFRVLLTTADQIAAAQAARAGGRATIPVGRIVAGPQVNTPWSWHLEDVRFAELAIEVCDAVPSFVEQQGGPQFALGTYCPWMAAVIGIQEQ
jgi:hypothetical protein